MSQNTSTAAPQCLLNPDCMRTVLQRDSRVLQHILRVLMEVPDLELTGLDTRYYVPDLRGDCARLLASAQDDSGTAYCILFLQPDKGLTPRQIRPYTDAILRESLYAGGEDSGLPKFYAVILTQEDLLGDGEGKHLFAMMEQDSYEVLPGNLVTIYGNGTYQGEDSIGRLMADLRETDPAKIHDDVIRSAVLAALQE